MPLVVITVGLMGSLTTVAYTHRSYSITVILATARSSVRAKAFILRTFSTSISLTSIPVTVSHKPRQLLLTTSPLLEGLPPELLYSVIAILYPSKTFPTPPPSQPVILIPRRPPLVEAVLREGGGGNVKRMQQKALVSPFL